MKYSEHMSANRRLCILRVLDSQAGYGANDSVIQTVLESLGHRVPRDQVREDFTFLKDHGLVQLEVVSGRVWVAQATARGLDVANGLVIVEGVQRPSPG